MRENGQAGETNSPTRIDGWKAIGAYFRRNRTTVFRWARDDGLPVRRVPIAGKGSVFAYAHELDAWLAAKRDSPTVPALPTRVDPYLARVPPRPWRWLPFLSQAVNARQSTVSR